MNAVAPWLFAVVICAPAIVNGYELRLVAQPGDVIAGQQITTISTGSFLEMNNNGEIVFVARTTGPTGSGWSVLTPDRFIAGAGKVVDGVVPVIDEEAEPAINDVGQVAYVGRLPDPNDIFSFAGGLFVDDLLTVQAGDVIDGVEIWSVDAAPSINNLGQTVFPSYPYADRSPFILGAA